MGSNAAGSMQKACYGAVWWEKLHFKAANQHSCQRFPAGISLQIMTIVCLAQLCLLSLTAVPYKTCAPLCELKYCEIFQEHYWTKRNSSTESVSSCIWTDNALCLKNKLEAAALRQKYRALLGPVGAPLTHHVCPLETFCTLHKTLKPTKTWWRVRLKTQQNIAVVRCNTLM